MPGLDEPGVHGADRDLIHAGSFDLDEREWLSVGLHRWRRPGLAAHRVPSFRPVLVQDEAAPEGVPGGDDAEQVAELALEPAGREREMGEGGHCRARGIKPDLELGPPVRRPGAEHVDAPGGVLIVVGGDRGEPVALGEEACRLGGQLTGRDLAGLAGPLGDSGSHRRGRAAANSARTMFSSLAKRLNGGRPRRATRPKPKIPPSTGRRDRRAGTFAISLVPSARRISPEARKSTPLARPWPRMCSRTAAIASELPAAAPRAIRPMCSMLWYASM